MMGTALAMFAPGVVGWVFKLFLAWGGIAYVLAALFHAWARRSWKIAAVSASMAAAFGFLFTPWTSMYSFETSNPNVIFWNPVFRAMTSVWLLASTASVVSIPMLWWMGKQLGQPVRRAHSTWWLPWTMLWQSSMPALARAGTHDDSSSDSWAHTRQTNTPLKPLRVVKI